MKINVIDDKLIFMERNRQKIIACYIGVSLIGLAVKKKGGITEWRWVFHSPPYVKFFPNTSSRNEWREKNISRDEASSTVGDLFMRYASQLGHRKIHYTNSYLSFRSEKNVSVGIKTPNILRINYASHQGVVPLSGNIEIVYFRGYPLEIAATHYFNNDARTQVYYLKHLHRWGDTYPFKKKYGIYENQMTDNVRHIFREVGRTIAIGRLVGEEQP